MSMGGATLEELILARPLFQRILNLKFTMRWRSTSVAKNFYGNLPVVSSSTSQEQPEVRTAVCPSVPAVTSVLNGELEDELSVSVLEAEELEISSAEVEQSAYWTEKKIEQLVSSKGEDDKLLIFTPKATIEILTLMVEEAVVETVDEVEEMSDLDFSNDEEQTAETTMEEPSETVEAKQLVSSAEEEELSAAEQLTIVTVIEYPVETSTVMVENVVTDKEVVTEEIEEGEAAFVEEMDEAEETSDMDFLDDEEQTAETTMEEPSETVEAEQLVSSAEEEEDVQKQSS
ncbi:hypothetical protein R1flu_015356 [Riccia fluitans]|uniref:Uncharacterized protein n=1 Tax=Riccia fluitans TaxID=41844 RepID=A0ABD1YJJ8_9MARC